MNDIDDEVETGVSQFQSVTETGEAVERRIATAEAAWRIYDDLRRADEPAARKRVKIKGLIDGNKPYDQKKLDEAGLGYITNINDLSAQGIMDDSAAKAHELHMELRTLAEFRFIGQDNPQKPGTHYAGILDEEFDRTVRKWSGFLPMFDKINRQADSTGIGGVVWRDEFDWRPKAFERGNLKLPNEAELDVDELEVFALNGEISYGEVFRLLKNESAATKAGWNVEALKELLLAKYAVKADSDDIDKFRTSQWESLQQKARNNDAMIQSTEYQKIKVIHEWCREVSGDQKITHVIINDTGVLDGCKEFLYEGVEKYEEMRNALWFLPYNYGDGWVSSVKGLGAAIAPHCELSSRFLGKMYDAGQLSATLIIQPKSAMDLAKVQMVRLGVITVLPDNVNIIQSSFQPQLNQLAQLREVSSSLMRNNNPGVGRTYTELQTEKQAQKTARQVAEESNQGVRYEKADSAMRYQHFDQLYTEMFRRMVNPKYTGYSVKLQGQKAAKDFVRRCISRGVPEEVLLDVDNWEVKAGRAIGLGSLGVKMDVTNKIFQMRSVLDAEGQTNAVREYLAVLTGGYRNVDKFKKPYGQDMSGSMQERMATLENNDFKEKAVMPVSYTDIHVAHIATHIRFMVATGQEALQGQADPMQAYQELASGMKHVGAHLQLLEQDSTMEPVMPQVKKLVQGAMGILQQVTAVAKKAQMAQQKKQQAQQAVVAGAQQQLVSQEAQLKMHEMDIKAQLMAQKNDSLNQMRMAKTQQGLQMKQQAGQFNMQLSAEKQAAAIQLAARVADAKIELERAIAQQEAAASQP